MRLLALVTDGFGTPGGIGQYNRDLLRALSLSASLREIVVLPRHGDSGGGTPERVVQLPAAADRLAWSARAAQLAVAGGFDAIFCGHLRAAPLAAFVARLVSRPLWLQVHGIEAWEFPGRGVRRATERASLVTSVSRYTRRRLLGWADIDPARVRVLPNTVAPVYTERRRPADLRARLGLVGRRVILTVGRMAASERYKGQDRVIGALPDVVRRVPSVAYLVVGTGDDHPRLERLAAEAGVADRVVFAGDVPGAELPDYFRLADVFAMPSTGEGFGIVFLEAAASGLAVIAANHDGSVDALADGAIGCLIDPDDQRQLADALVAALEGQSSGDPACVQRFAARHFNRTVDDLVQHFF